MIQQLRERAASGPQLGFCVMYPAPGIIERVGSDWDWLWIDGQHGELDYSDVLAAVRAGDLIGRPSVVRVPGHDSGAIGKALDTYAAGVMVPMVDTAEQARAIVQSAKFPPLGSRSYGGRRPIDRVGRAYANSDEPQPVLICQIETPLGLENADPIAAMDGVDALFFGPDDMALREALPMEKPREKGHFDTAMRKVADIALAHGKMAGCVVGSPEDLKKAADMGYSLIVAGGDVMLLAGGSSARVKTMREALGASGTTAKGSTSLY